MKGEFMFLGTGGSLGVPEVGCHCGVCRSTNPENQRFRSAGLLTINDKKLLIDVGPDIRSQALTFQIERLDGVLITHPHYDHIGGLDDLRIYYFLQKKPLPCLLSRDSLSELQQRYHYMMRPIVPGKSITAQIDFQVLDQDFGVQSFLDIPIEYMTYTQTGMNVTGFRIGGFAYISDIREYTDEVIQRLQGIDLLILSALRHTPTLMHFSLDEAVAFSRHIQAKRTYFTHIAHDLDHDTTNRMLPSDIRLGYDGLELSF